MDDEEVEIMMSFSEFKKTSFTLDFLLILKKEVEELIEEGLVHQEYMLKAFNIPKEEDIYHNSLLNIINKKISEKRKEKINKLLNEK